MLLSPKVRSGREGSRVVVHSACFDSGVRTCIHHRSPVRDRFIVLKTALPFVSFLSFFLLQLNCGVALCLLIPKDNIETINSV